MKLIKLGGVLGERFGKEFSLDVSNAREACQALSRMIAGFEEFMLNAHHSGIRFAVWNEDNNISEYELPLHTKAEVITIDPVVGASKEGLLNTILGVVLIVVGVVMNVYAPGSGMGVIAAGAAMLVGGVVQMLNPVGDPSDNNGDGNKANKGFGGAVTTVAQGNVVPILYGERAVGGFLVSGEIIAEDE